MDARVLNEGRIPKRILKILLDSLSNGVVPRSGAPYIAIGRTQEIASLLENLETCADGGSFTRFLIGRYGSGKSFLIQLIRGNALERDFLCADADLSPERRLTGGNGGGLATYRELIHNLSSRLCPNGMALSAVLGRSCSEISASLAQSGQKPDTEEGRSIAEATAERLLAGLSDQVCGFDFVMVLRAYFRAFFRGADAEEEACLRFLRGEFGTKTEARAALPVPVSDIVRDDNWYDYMKLWACLAVRLGYKGLLVCIDECVNLYKIPNRIAREANYEKMLGIFNDTLQGLAPHLGVIFGGTPQFLEDTRRGLFSYDALRSRLTDSRYVKAGYQNLSSPVIRLQALSPNELLALINRLSKLSAMLEGTPEQLTAAQMEQFLSSQLSRPGAGEMVTPREMIRDFMTVLHMLRENPDLTFEQILSDSQDTPAGQAAGPGASISFDDLEF